MKVAIYTLGCKVNQYETQAMEQTLRAKGHQVVDFSDEADAYVVNTCSVTAVSDQKSRQAIHRVQKQHPAAVVAVCGCYPQTHAEDVRKLGVDLIAGTGDREGFITMLEEAAAGKKNLEAIDRSFERRTFEVLPAGGMEGRTRAMLKIEDGCLNFCTYCVIPFTRGRVRSLPLEAAARQAKQLQDEGYRELVITGIEIASYGSDLPGKPNLADCVEAIAAAAPEIRLRLGSLEPTVITEDFARRIAATGRVCPHFHLSLQSGCDKTLKNMNRKYDTARFYQCVEVLEKYFPGCAFTADLITGFPGETLEDQAETLEFIRKCRFSDMHIFPYSVRPGTKAEKMPGQVTKNEKARRAHEAQKVADEMHRTYMENCVGKTIEVLFETHDGNLWHGHGANYCTVVAEGENLRGLVKNVKISGISGENLVGEVV